MEDPLVNILKLKSIPEVARSLESITDPAQRAAAEAQLDEIIKRFSELTTSFSTTPVKKVAEPHK